MQVWLAGPEAAAEVDRGRLSAADRARSARLAGGRKETEWLASRALGQRLAPEPGTPTSLSHAAGCAAFATGPGGTRVGVDLEAVRPRQVLRLARFSFAPEEAAQLEALEGEDALEHFYLLWTLKEASAKALGLPLLAALHECRFIRDDGRWHGRLPCAGPWAARAWMPRPALFLSVMVLDLPGRPDSWCCSEWPGAAVHWPLKAGLASPGP